jgi:hypothetical protein
VRPPRPKRAATSDPPVAAPRSPFHQHFVPYDMHLIHPEHPPANPGSPDPASPHIGPSSGLLSERRLVYCLSGAPTERSQSE